MTYTDQHTLQSRFFELTDLLSAGCDPEFDNTYDDLDREFQELRLQLNSFQ